MFKTTTYYYTPNKLVRNYLRLFHHISKNLFNSTLYELKKMYRQTSKICTNYELNKIMKSNPNFHILNTYISICIIRNVYTMFNNYLKGYTKCPRYLNKHGYYLLYTEQIRVKKINNKKYIDLPLSNITRTSKIFEEKSEDELINYFISESGIKKKMDINFKIPKHLYNKVIKAFRIIPCSKARKYKIELTYIEKEETINQVKEENYLSIDLGINNLASFVITKSNESFIIDGKYLKSVNQYYNKQIAHYNSKKKEKEYTLKQTRITEKRNRRIEDYLNKTTRYIINKAIKEKVSEIIIGWNRGMKEKGIKNKELTNLEKQRINQTIIQIPIGRLKEKIIYQARIKNIKCTIINESYTSKCSFYDSEEIKYHNKYLGERIKRGLYETKEKRIVNADINGALNILKKSKIDNYQLIDNLRNRGITLPKRVPSKVILGESTVF